MKRFIFIAIIVFSTFDLSAKKETSQPHKLKYNTNTIYEEKTFKTTSAFLVKAPWDTANLVMEKFAYDLDHDPFSLFDNLLRGLGDTDENGNDNNVEESSRFSVDIKSCDYDSAHDYYIGKLDFLIGKITIRDITLYGRITKKYDKDNATFAFELLNNSIAKKARGVITTRYIDDTTTRVDLKADFQFSWFLNIFFSLKNYKNVAEWRLDKFMQNLSAEILKAKNK